MGYTVVVSEVYVLENSTIYDKPVRMRTMLKFTFPTMVLMVFSSLYTVADGIVVSNFVGSLGLSAINIVYPLLNVTMAVSLMLSTGSNAIIAKKLGEGKGEEANRFMTLVTLVTVAAVGILVTVMMLFAEPLYYLLGSDDELLPYCVEYGKIVVPGAVFMALQFLFQTYLVTADRPGLSMWLTVLGGVINIVLDIILVGPLNMGVTGAAIASVAGQFVSGIIPTVMFFSDKMLIHFQRPKWEGRQLLFAMGNGSSEMVSSMASAIITVIYNLQMMALVGEKGVAAISAVLYLDFIFVAIFIGFSSGIGPVISYNYGAEHHRNLQKLFRICMKVILFFSLVMFALSEIFNKTLAMVFASSDPVLAELMISGFRIFAVKFLFSGMIIMASGFFTSLNNGKISALISFLRTFALEMTALILLPKLLGLTGVWAALPISESIGFVISVGLLWKYRKVYHY